MRSKFIIFTIISCGFLFLPASNIFADMTSENYTIWADVFNSGGTEDSTSANYGMQDSIGEDVILSNTSTSATYGIKAGFREMYPDAYIIFALGSKTMDLGELSQTATKSASHTMRIETNATNGFTITLTGSSLQKGLDFIAPIGSEATEPLVGTEQFGLNLVANTSPAIGINPTGTAPIGSAADQFNQPNKFAFASPSVVATSSQPVNQTNLTASYIANISMYTISGDYSTTLTYKATANY